MINILVTGGESMIGRAFSDILDDSVYKVYSPKHSSLNLLTYNQVEDFIYDLNIEYVVHLATYSGNIQFNQRYPADTFYQTSQMALNVLTAASKYRKVKKVLSVLSSCAIGDKGEEELFESDLHLAPPNPSIESHGYAKRILDIYSRQLYKQTGFNAVTCIVNNSFGPYDSFSLSKTKVVAAFIKKYYEAQLFNTPYVENWGTGIAKREFIYCDDVARLLLLALEYHNDPLLPVNIGSPFEITIKELAETIAQAVGYKGETRWLKEKGDGQLRKKLNLTRMNEVLRIKKFNYTPFIDAINQTVNWYRANRDSWTK